MRLQLRCGNLSRFWDGTGEGDLFFIMPVKTFVRNNAFGKNVPAAFKNERKITHYIIRYVNICANNTEYTYKFSDSEAYLCIRLF